MALRYYNDFTLLSRLPQHITCLRTGSAWAINEGRLQEYIGAQARLIVGSGLLVEPADTNLLPYGRIISAGNGWTISNGTDDTTIGIDGLADTGTEITPSGTCVISRTIAGSYGKYTFSVFLKLAQGNEDPVYISMNSTRIECEGATTDWQRFTVSVSTGTPTVRIECTEKIYIDCLQLETGLVASSPIPTTAGSTVTRNEEKLAIAWPVGGVTPFNPSAGTFVINVLLSHLDTSTQALFKMYDAFSVTTPNLLITARRTDVTQYGVGYNNPAEFTTTTVEDESPQYDLNIRIATSYIDGIQNVAINGLVTLESGQTETIAFSDITSLSLGSDEYLNQMSGFITELSYYDEYFDIPQLIELSTSRVGELAEVRLIPGEDELEFDEVISALYRNRNKISMYNFIQSLDNNDVQEEETRDEVQVLNNLNMTNNLN